MGISPWLALSHPVHDRPTAVGNGMGARDQVEATDRLRRALLAFQAAQTLFLGAHRRLRDLPQAEVDAYWDGPGRSAEANMRAAAAEVVATFKAFSAAGLVAEAADRHAVTQAERHLKEGAP